MTEAADQFGQPAVNNQQSNENIENKELKNYLKGHHFDFGIKASKTCQNKNPPYLRSDALKSGLAFERSNQEFKKDQQKAHFNFGFDPRPTSANNLGLISSTKVYSN